ncbi:MAG: hypothetical protein PHH60_01225 [Candidatus Margulisbacteria bacterium]|nr:hypothetical protein [Candidatus Margulisiibacteriota bacterium]
MDLNLLVNSFNLALSKVSPMVVNLIAALILILVGLLVAKGLGMLTTFVLKAIKIDKGAEQIGFAALLEKGDIKRNTSELLGDLVYWFIVLIDIIGVAGVFGLAVEPVLTRIFTYMGVVFLAALIIGLGLFLAGLISGIVKVVMVNLGIQGAKTASRIIYLIVVIFTFLAALAELGFSPDWTPHIGIILGMPALAAAIAFGLGCKDMAADFLHNLFKGK